MKKYILMAALFISFVGCTSQQSNQLSQEEKDQIKKEVKVTVDSMFAKWGRLDLDGALQYYSPELVVMGDSTIMDYQTGKKGWMEFFGSVESADWPETHLELIVVTRDVVISAWVGKMNLVFKSGNKLTADPMKFTDVFKKSGGQWKAVYEHGSGCPVMEEAAKK
jgi:ketosteroid isomerase-like protein